MPDQDANLNKQFIEITEAISRLIRNADAFNDLKALEDWLKFQLDRLKVHNIKTGIPALPSEHTEKPFKDGIIIFDSSFTIIHSSGLQNLAKNSYLQDTSRLSFYDLINEADLEKFKEYFQNACQKEYKNGIQISIKTGFGIYTSCNIKVDTLSGSTENNRYVACLQFPKHYEAQLTDYQSIIFENLKGMDIYMFDRDYRFMIAGGDEKQRFKLSNNDFVGKTLFEILDKKTARNLFPFYNKALNGEQAEGEVRYKDDIYSIIATPVKDQDNNTVAGIIIAQNVTNDKLLEEQLKKGKEEAQQADKAKSIFIANMSHEIRTPLNSIIGFAEQMGKTKLTREQEKYLSLIQKAADHLLYLVTEIVFLFKLGLGKVYIEKQPFSLKEVIDELEDAFIQQAADNKLQFELFRDPALPNYLEGDPFRLRQILSNLLINAIKYTKKGGISLRIYLEREYKRKVKLRFEIADTGIGISKRDLPNIFNVFEQGANQKGNTKSGAGLGLGICQKLTELQGGEISVESKINVGSTFKVKLPFIKTDKTELIKSSKEYNINDQNLAGKKVLFADDDEHNLLLAETILKNWETNYTLVSDGHEAIKELSKNKYDVALIDIHMPKKNGIDVIRSLRSSPQGPNYLTPSLAVTANALKSDIHKYIKSGFDDYLIKPFREAEFYNKLCNLLGIETNDFVRQAEKNKNPETDMNDTFDISDLEAAANGDNEFIAMMINNFIDKANTLYNLFAENIEHENWKEIGEKAHKAIPSFKYFKLYKTGIYLEEIENLALREKQYTTLPQKIKEVMILIEKIISDAKLLVPKA